MKTIIVVIDSQGDIRIEASGFAGRTCAKATFDLEKVLGTPQKRRFKPEYYRTNSAHNTQCLKQSQ